MKKHSGTAPLDLEKLWIQKLIAPFLKKNHKPLVVPAGADDAAVLKWGSSDLVVTMDTLTESIDFEHAWMPPFFLGYKSLAVNLSDLAAMGARAKYAMLSVTLNKKRFKTTRLQSQFFDQFSKGFSSCAERFAVHLIGGDLGSSPKETSITVCVFGSAPQNLLRRSGARAGDRIVVAGSLGLARRGLLALLSGKKPKRSEHHAFFTPRPLLELGEKLTRLKGVHAAMDISDGLSRDLGRLSAQNELGFDVDLNGLAERERLSAWVGGEDYALLLAVEPRSYASVKRAGLRLRVPIRNLGFFHPQKTHRKISGLPTQQSLIDSPFEHF